MRLAAVRVSGVRNLADQEVELVSGLNLLMGANGQGKSSFLEAIYLLGTTRSFRTSRLADLISTGGEAARVAGRGTDPGETLAVLISREEKSYLKDGKPVEAAEYIGRLDVVALSSEIAQNFRRRPAERRRFLDRMALATYPGYLFELRDLRRACAHRSVLVATGRRGAERRAWDERAAALALPVARRRQEMTLALGAGLHGAAASILPEAGAVGVRYQSRPPFDPGNETRYLEALNEIFAAQGTVKDRERSGSRMGDLGEAGPERGSPGLQGGGRDDEEGFEATTEAAGAARRPGTGAGGGPGSSRRETPAGPLRDDLVIELEGKDLLRFGSSGQYRSFLTAAALAEMTRLEAVKGEVPVLLLDDVDADLDEGRYRALLESVSGRAQVVAATSKPGLALGGPTGGSPATGGAGGRFEVRAGRIRPMPPA